MHILTHKLNLVDIIQKAVLYGHKHDYIYRFEFHKVDL